jgi:hypothetical protein
VNTVEMTVFTLLMVHVIMVISHSGHTVVSNLIRDLYLNEILRS